MATKRSRRSLSLAGGGDDRDDHRGISGNDSDAAAAAGIDAPIVPGILPIENFDRMKGFAERCGTHIPPWMRKGFANAPDEENHDLLSVAICAEQCDDLIENGVEQLHLYTMNKPDLPYQVLSLIHI